MLESERFCQEQLILQTQRYIGEIQESIQEMYTLREEKLAEDGVTLSEVIELLKEEREVVRTLLKHKKIKEYTRQLDLIKAQHQLESKKYMKPNLKEG